MNTAEMAVHELAASQQGLISRAQVLGLGLTPDAIHVRTRRRSWRPVYPGVYLIGVTPPTWSQKLRAACLFAGPHAVASHRAAAVVWGLDGLVRSPIEITVPHGEEATLRGVVVHRSRKLDACDSTVTCGQPVTIAERTLADLGRYVGERELEKALESALRRRLCNPARLWTYVDERAPLTPSTRQLRRLLLLRSDKPAAGSGGEVELLQTLRRVGIPEPERQFPLHLPSGRVVRLDFGWPQIRLGLEYDGYDIHGGRLAHNADLARQNEIVIAGWTLLRYSGLRVRAEPVAVAEEIASFYSRLTSAA